MQKSIRRGFSEYAVRYADALYDYDPIALINKISSICLEDIGLANIDLVYHYISNFIDASRETKFEDNKDKHVSLLNKNTFNIIQDKGGKDYLLEFINLCCSSVKDRSCSDLADLASVYQDKIQDETKTKEQIFLDPLEPVVNRLLSGWEILGSQKMKNNFFSTSNRLDDLEKFVDINRKIVQKEQIIDIMQISYQTHTDPFFIAMGLLESVFEKEKNMMVGKYKTGDFVSRNLHPYAIKSQDGPLLIEGIDWGTTQGYLAIEDFLNKDIPIVHYLNKNKIPKENWIQTIGALQFRTCGHIVNHRLVYPSAVVILKMTQKMLLKKSSNNMSIEFSEASPIFEKSLDELYQSIKDKIARPDASLFPF